MTEALKFTSSRAGAPLVALSDAIRQGLAPDGGLYVPTRLPLIDASSFGGLTRLPEIARRTLDGFFEGDRLRPMLGEIAEAALDFPAPTTAVTACPDPLFVLELFHGPTAAFKDFGARFLAETMQRLQTPAEPPMTILVATSGDTGGAVASAFHLRPWVRIVVLYPKGLVSARQEQQLTCWGDNVMALRIDGTFDDCQRLVKEAFVDFTLRAKHRFSSANSINIGRLLPQMVYYAASSLDVRAAHGCEAFLHHPGRKFGQRVRGHLGAGGGVSHRAHRFGAQRQSYRARFPGIGRLAAARQHRNPGLGDGRGQPEQYGAHPRLLPDLRFDQRTLERGERR